MISVCLQSEKNKAKKTEGYEIEIWFQQSLFDWQNQQVYHHER